MRLIDADTLERKLMAMPDEDLCEDCCYNVVNAIAEMPTVSGWVSADKRPPKQGRYLVWGLTRITPDHYDEANGFWEIQPAFWFEKSGWDRKVKFWQMLPDPPKEVTGDE